MYENVDLPKESKCSDCIYRLSQILIPFNYEEFDIEEGSAIAINSCLLTEMDISEQIMLECTKYQSINDNSNLFLANKFLNR